MRQKQKRNRLGRVSDQHPILSGQQVKGGIEPKEERGFPGGAETSRKKTLELLQPWEPWVLRQKCPITYRKPS